MEMRTDGRVAKYQRRLSISDNWKEGLSLALLLLLPFAGGHGDAHRSPGLLSVPGPPERATLETIAATTLRVAFEPPLSDGGSKVFSYLIEWDKEAGTPEVRPDHSHIPKSKFQRDPNDNKVHTRHQRGPSSENFSHRQGRGTGHYCITSTGRPHH